MKNKKLFAILTLVCFMMTLMPVAAFAGEAKSDTSFFLAADGDQTVTSTKAAKGIDFITMIQDADEEATTASALMIWAVDATGARTSALTVASTDNSSSTIHQSTALDDAWYVTDVKDAQTIVLKFSRSGEYTVYAGFPKANETAANLDSTGDVNLFGERSKITVTSSSEDPDLYSASVRGNSSEVTANGNYVAPYGVSTTNDTDNGVAVERSDKNGVVGTVSLNANNVTSDKIYVKFMDKEGKALRGETVTIESNSAAVEVNKTSATTNSLGEVDFQVSGSIEGTYEVELSLNGVTWIVKVTIGDTGAAYIELAEQPSAPQALYGNLNKTDSTQGTKIRFNITDINGNVVKGTNRSEASSGMGLDGTLLHDGKYIVLTSKPSASNLESENLKLYYSSYDQQWYLGGISNLDAEGTYTVRVILDNGAYATATWEVKKFETPVQLRIDTSVNTVALGGSIGASLTYVDANGVEKTATDATLTATGYAVAGVSGTKVTAKNDEKYVGETITVTAVSERYNLVATKEYTVVGEATAVAFVDKNADVNVNNRLEWNLVDENGNRIAIGNTVGQNTIDTVNIQYVVLDKPENAKVTVTDASSLADVQNKGIGKMSLTSNTVGNVAVQVVVSVVTTADSTGAQQTKYYTGSQIFAVGNSSTGDVVVMSIGSNEIIVNDAKATIDSAPIIQNDRTYVPFRALAEAFGAEVAYDEATQAVTAELNGVTVVMTIGSATYTVNGTEQTMDVAPFISGSRTMVPVRFVAEAFGIKVIPTYDQNGATADILFNL